MEIKFSYNSDEVCGVFKNTLLSETAKHEMKKNRAFLTSIKTVEAFPTKVVQLNLYMLELNKVITATGIKKAIADDVAIIEKFRDEAFKALTSQGLSQADFLDLVDKNSKPFKMVNGYLSCFSKIRSLDDEKIDIKENDSKGVRMLKNSLNKMSKEKKSSLIEKLEYSDSKSKKTKTKVEKVPTVEKPKTKARGVHTVEKPKAKAPTAVVK